jgi:AraC family transcriptional regulator, chitin signaling transcriptional activator
LKTRATYLFLLVFGTLVTFAQKFPEKGVPLLQNFTPAQYYNRGKVWDIRSASSGIVYMAADKGLVEYDGKTWKSYKGSSGFTRSVLVINDSLIYTGSDLDFGVWTKNKYQAFEYNSLYPFREDIQDISEEFWDVHKMADNVIFVSSQNMYVYKNGQLTKISAPYKFSGSFAVNDSLYFADERQGLYVFNDLSLKQVFKYPDDLTFQISGIFTNKLGMVIVTRNSGLYIYSSGNLSPWTNTLSQNLKTDNVFSFEQINSTHMAFGTVQKGLYITDLEGKIIHQINKQKGLPNNTILCLHYSPAGKLWLGMDYGISALDLRSKLTYFYDYRGDFGTGQSALVKNEIFYLGTNQGLYKSGWKDLNNDVDFNRFQLVPGTEGQVWTLANIDNNLLIGHDKGLLALKGNTVEKLSSQEGVWTILPYKDFLLTGNYNGISIFRKSESKWTFLKKMDLILGSCNQIIIEKDNILWVNIPNFGIIRAVLDPDLNPADRMIFEENIFEGNNLYVTRDEKGIHVFSDKFQYTFDTEVMKFHLKAETQNQPNIEGLIPGIYISGQLHPDYEFYPVYNGFALRYLKTEEEMDAEQPALILRKIEAFNNDNRVQLYPGEVVPYRLNNLKIQYIVPNQDHVLYQYKLNESDPWTSWVQENSLEFLDIKFGEFTLYVRASVNGKISEAKSISFRIAPPWNRTGYAYAFYVFWIALLGYFIFTWQKLSLKKQRKKLLIKEKKSLRKQAEKHNREISLLEQERLKAEVDQVKQQLKNKTIELANKARDNEEKNRLILTLKEKCEKAQDNPVISNRMWREMQRLLDSYLNIEDKTFEIQMDELHQDFFRKLKEQFPGLSTNDLRLCAYLKIGLNSKEIADILNIQPSSAYISRSRLRKKLNLDVDEDLHDFLITI